MAWSSTRFLARAVARAVATVLARSSVSEVTTHPSALVLRGYNVAIALVAVQASPSALYVRLEDAISGRSPSATNQLAKEIRERFKTGQITRRKDDVMDIVPQVRWV